MYTPIIRSRQGEVSALKALSANAKADCMPLLDLPAPTKKADQDAAKVYTQRNIQRLEKSLNGFSNVLVDSSELDPSLRLAGGNHPLVAAASAIVTAGCKPVPVTGLHRDSAHIKAVTKIIATMGGQQLCFRLDPTDIGTASQTYKQTLAALTQTPVGTKDVILLLDLQSVFDQNPEALAAQVSRFMNQATKSQWAGFIVAGYGIPDQMTQAVAVRAQGYVPRVEQEVYRRVASTHALNNLWFGDYTTLSPTQVELDFRLVQKVMSPKAIYTLAESWFIVRGGPFSSHADGYAQYYDIAAEIVALDEFSGSDYSFGDEYIHERSLRTGTTGSPQSWITASVNHHVTLTAESHHL